jgi:HD-GYP domain-containing protein (c-di-GMP phosphodiesterase class II)
MSGEAIPLGARIVAIADAYDAITFGRPYRRARSHDEAADELRRCSGSQFDPALVPLFLDETERVASGLPPSANLPLAALLERHIPVAPRPVRAA